MSQAESIKQYVEVKDLSTEDRSQREEQEAKESASKSQLEVLTISLNYMCNP